MALLPKEYPVRIDFKVTTEPTAEPVTVEEVKHYARIDGSASDEYLAGLIKAIRKNVEGILGRALIQQTITCYMDQWPGIKVELPRPPLLSITAVRTRDEEGNTMVYDADNYFVITAVEPGSLVIKQSATVPINTDRNVAGYEIEYKAGYGTTAASVPEPIKESIKAWVANVYDTRVLSNEPPPEVVGMLMLYKVGEWL